MEYTDYRTNKTISREQYIANGLERGELLYKLECGCVIIQDRTADAYIVFCPLHEAAPDLYEACKAIWEAHKKAPLDHGIALLAEISKLDTLITKVKSK